MVYIVWGLSNLSEHVRHGCSLDIARCSPACSNTYKFGSYNQVVQSLSLTINLAPNRLRRVCQTHSGSRNVLSETPARSALLEEKQVQALIGADFCSRALKCIAEMNWKYQRGIDAEVGNLRASSS